MPNNIPQIEFGFMLCRLPTGQLTRGAIGVGTATGVQFSDKCPPPSTVVGSVHSHPKSGGGDIRPSAQDMREAKRIGMPKLCIINDSLTQCYHVRGAQAK